MLPAPLRNVRLPAEPTSRAPRSTSNSNLSTSPKVGRGYVSPSWLVDSVVGRAVSLLTIAHIVPITATLSPGRSEQSDVRPDALQLRFPNCRTSQCPRDRGSNIARSPSDAPNDCPKRERASFDRTEYQFRADIYQDQAGRRDRAHPRPQVHSFPDAESRIVFHIEKETNQGTGHASRKCLVELPGVAMPRGLQLVMQRTTLTYYCIRDTTFHS